MKPIPESLPRLPSFDDSKNIRHVSTGVVIERRRHRNSTVARRASSWKRFSPVVSTELYNKDDKASFYGPYAHLRKELDYGYHSRYRKERQWLQDSIIEDMLADDLPDDPEECITPTEPWLIFTVGPRGAGKGHVIRELVNNGRLPLLRFQKVDPDEIRRRLPEFNSYAEKNPYLVDELTRKESGYIAEILSRAALQSGRNVVLDVSMHDASWHVQLIQTMRRQYAHLKVGIVHVDAPLELIVQRGQKKSFDTGRDIPEESIESCLEWLPESIAVVKPSVDFCCEIRNGRGELELVGMEWDDFKTTFLQTCAWKPGMKAKENGLTSSGQPPMAANHMRHKHKHRFSVLFSSEENNRADNDEFFGKYSHIRKTLDYTYHANYTFERQKLQDAIISDMLDAAIILDVNGKVGPVPTEPWIVFTAGAMGAGKSHTMNSLVKMGHFPLRAFVVVDPDEIRRLLPEYHVYINENPVLAGQLTRKEAGYIAEILTLAALQAGKNVLQDGSLRDSDWYQIYFKRLREEFPLVRQAILHVTAPREEVLRRASDRAVVTGRIVPDDVLEAALAQVPRSVEILAPLVDYYAEIHNADDVELVKPEGATWVDFSKRWHQHVAYETAPRL